MILKIILLPLFFLLLIDSFSQSNSKSETLYSIQELQEDLEFWKNKLKTKHPIVYQYNSPIEFEKYFDSIKKRIDHAMTASEFHKEIASTNAFIKCAHSQVRSSTELETLVMTDSSLIPLDIQWYSGKAYITYNYTTNNALSAGNEVIKINGFKTSEIYQKCKELVPRDASNVQYARHWVNQQFYFYYHLLYGMSNEYTITIGSGSADKKVNVNGMSLWEMDQVFDQSPPIHSSLTEGMKFFFIDSLDAAYIYVGSFSSHAVKEENGMKMKKYIDFIFDKIDSSGVENLVIDLKGNAGGSPTLSLYLLRYVMLKEFEFKAEIRKLKNHKASTFDKRTKNTLFSDGSRGHFKPFKTAFSGNLFVLQDGGTVSAGSEFTSVIRRYSRGPIIGEESGGNPEIMTGYWFYWGKKTLPNTKFRYGVADRTVIMNTEFKDKACGLIPDHLVVETIDDYLNGFNRGLHLAKQLIQKQ